MAISLPALVPAGSLLGVNMELVGILSTESVLQGAIFTSPLPMLPLLPVALIAPEAPTLDGFQVGNIQSIQQKRRDELQILEGAHSFAVIEESRFDLRSRSSLRGSTILSCWMCLSLWASLWTL